MAEESDPRSALRRAMQEKRPSAFKVSLVCREGLKEKVPVDLRAGVWQLLLGVEAKDRFLLDDSIRDTVQDLENQRVIRVDAQRTRADVADFREPEIEALVCRLLTFYCKRKNIKYKQGLNEVLAPFIMLRRPPLPDGTLFNLFYAFIERFLPHMYVHEEFHALQCTFRLFRLLLQYHDPELCNRLDTHNLPPELYATPWFLTMFARNVPLDVLYKLWDIYLLQEGGNGALLNMFIALALLLENRKGLLSIHQSDLPIFVNSMLGPASFSPERFEQGESEEKADVRSLVEHFETIVEFARELKKSTPNSLSDLFSKSVLFRQCPSFSIVEWLESLPCLLSSPDQVVQLIVNKDRKREEQMIIQLIDCRRAGAFEDEHLLGSLHLDPDLLNLPDQLEEAIKALSDRTVVGSISFHIVLVGHSEKAESDEKDKSDLFAPLSSVSQDCILFTLHLIQREFKKVSVIDGGWEALKAAADQEPIFEHGISIDSLVVPLRTRQSSVGSSDALENDNKRERKESVQSWTQRIGISLSDTPKFGSFFSTTSSTSSAQDSLDTKSEPCSATQDDYNQNQNASSIPGFLKGKLPFGFNSTSKRETTTAENVAKDTDQGQEDPLSPKSSSPKSAGLMSSLMAKVKDFGQKATSPNTVEECSNDLISVSSDSEAWFDIRVWEAGIRTKEKDEVALFAAKEEQFDLAIEGNDGKMPQKLVLAITSGYVLRLVLHPDRPNFARLEEKFLIADLLKITSKKGHPNLVVFHFKNRGGQGQEYKTSLILSEARACIDAVKNQFTKLNSCSRGTVKN